MDKLTQTTAEVQALLDAVPGKEPGDAAIQAHITSLHVQSAADIGLGSADDVADVNKPVSILQQESIDSKAKISANKMLRVVSNDPVISVPYSSDKTATNDVSEQYEAFSDSSIAVVIENSSAVNVTYGYGATPTLAKTNVSDNAVNAGQTVSVIRKSSDNYYAWISTGATVTVKISQGA